MYDDAVLLMMMTIMMMMVLALGNVVRDRVHTLLSCSTIMFPVLYIFRFVRVFGVVDFAYIMCT